MAAGKKKCCSCDLKKIIPLLFSIFFFVILQKYSVGVLDEIILIKSNYHGLGNIIVYSCGGFYRINLLL